MPSYDPGKVSLICGGVNISGFGEEDIEVAFTDEDDVKELVGIKGEHSFTENQDKSGSITFTLKQSSKVAQAALETLRSTRESFSVMLKDLSGGSPITVISDVGRIKNRRNPKRGKEETSEEYIIALGTMSVADA